MKKKNLNTIISTNVEFIRELHFRGILTSVLAVLAICAAAFQTTKAQQGGLDTTFGTNSTGIYQDNLPVDGDPQFNVGRTYSVSEVLADGKIVVAGSSLKRSGGSYDYNDFVVRRLNADGSPDTTFGINGSVQTNFLTFGTELHQQSSVYNIQMKVQPSDGKIVVAGQCVTNMALGTDLCLIRYNQNGTIDTSFGGNTVTAYSGNPNFPPETFTMDAGKIFTRVGVAEGNPAVTLGGFGGSPVKIRIATDGRIYVFGNGADAYFNNGWYGKDKGFVAIYSTSGVLQQIISLVDTTGNNNDGFGGIRIGDGDLLSNGDYVAVGTHQQVVSVNPTVRSAVRWKIFSGNSGGGFLDGNVNTGGVPLSLTMLRSNKILVGGSFGNAPNFSPALVRYNGDLTVDTTFGTNGRYDFAGTFVPNYANQISELKTQPDGKIIGKANSGIIRLNPNGTPDRSFARVRTDVADSLDLRGILSAGQYATPFATGGDLRIGYGGVSFQSNGRLITAGSTFNGRYAIVTRLKTSFRNGGTFSDFNNDGKTEVAVFRGGIWYYLDSFSNASSGFAFGTTTDKPVPADYDGDGKTDTAVYRPSSGIWYIYQSSNNQVRGFQFGAAEDLPRPCDFNGDGQADIAVFRPSNGTWYVSYSNPIQPGNITFTAIQFGQSGDAPLLADFDGDGKSDFAVYRGGTWYYLRSSDGGFRAVNFGIAGDIPTIGDYDGDAQSDVSVFRPSNGFWYRLNSSNGAFVFNQFGQNGDKPSPGDYDNDGKTDLAVFRSGIWYALRSADNSVFSTAFGTANDTPVPAAYLP